MSSPWTPTMTQVWCWLTSMIAQMCLLLFWMNIWSAAAHEECGPNPNTYCHYKTFVLMKCMNYKWLSSKNFIRLTVEACGSLVQPLQPQCWFSTHFHMSIPGHILCSGLPVPFKLPVTSKTIQSRHKTLWVKLSYWWCVNKGVFLNKWDEEWTVSQV